MNPELIKAFEDGTLNLKDFDHKKHVYVAYVYLNQLPRKMAIEKYCTHLKVLLDKNGYGWKFSREVTENHINMLDVAMKQHPESSFEEVVKLSNSK